MSSGQGQSSWALPLEHLFNDDESGALADIYEKLSQENINVKESSGIADINSGYGVVIYLVQEDCEKAMAALEM